jgi:hypothetical protein
MFLEIGLIFLGGLVTGLFSYHCCVFNRKISNNDNKEKLVEYDEHGNAYSEI